jgi:environmental stress-induced protein Ves
MAGSEPEPELESELVVWPAAGRPAVPWRNGGGITREVAAEPAGSAGAAGGAGAAEFAWRISLAEVGASGPFSAFEGVDRCIVLLDGPAMTLTIDGVEHRLQRHQPLRFDGGSATDCEVSDGPTRDLNVMTRRGLVEADVEIQALDAEAELLVEPAEPLVLLAIQGSLTVGTPLGPETLLGALDALRWSGRRPLAVRGPGVAAVVRFARSSPVG